MTTMHRRRQWRDKQSAPMTLDELRMSNQYIGVLCGLAGIGTALVLLVLIFGQPLVDALFGG